MSPTICTTVNSLGSAGAMAPQASTKNHMNLLMNCSPAPIGNLSFSEIQLAACNLQRQQQLLFGLAALILAVLESTHREQQGRGDGGSDPTGPPRRHRHRRAGYNTLGETIQRRLAPQRSAQLVFEVIHPDIALSF